MTKLSGWLRRVTTYFVVFFRWNNLKMKVAQAKQRLGPRIQSEEIAVTAVSIV